MATLRPEEIRSMTFDEMLQKLREMRSELARARTTVAAGGSLENPARIRELKRAIARILTVIREKQKGGG
ncbi:MAG: 50S ribosomal protein L29 [Candidatus Hadarchaeaceae archaeon]